MSDITCLQNDIHEWANSVFPNRTISSVALKLYEEFGELLRNPYDPDEHADVFIMMLDLSKMYGVDIVGAIRHKMSVNRCRNWKVSDIGTMNHTQDSFEFYQMGVNDFKMGAEKLPGYTFPTRNDYLEYTRGYHNTDGEGDTCD